MNRLLLIFLTITLGTFLACGDDTGDGSVSLEITTEDGVENFGSIVPSDPSFANYQTDINPWLDILLIQAYANGYIAPRNQVMNKVVSKSALIRGEYLVLDVPSGKDLIFVVNAIDKNKVIQYSGQVGPVSIRPRSIIPLNVTLSKMIDLTTYLKTDSITLRLRRNDGDFNFNSQIDRFNQITPNVIVNMYTQAVYENDRWMPTNPDVAAYDFTVGGTYGASQWTGGNFLNKMFILITAHVEDDSKGVIFYGARAYNTFWYPGDLPPATLDIFMQHISRIAVRFNSYPGSTNVLATMIVNGNEVQLYRSGSFTDYVATISLNNPVAVFSAPSGQEWFGENSTIQPRTVNIYMDNYPGTIMHTVTMPIEWGINRIDVP